MRILKNLLPLLVLLFWSATVKADYNPANPPEPGVYFTLTTRCIPEDAAYYLTPTQQLAFGSQVNLFTTPTQGYRFIQWEDENGNAISDQNDFYYNMPAKDVIMTARFVYDPDSPIEPSTPEFKTVSAIRFITMPAEAGYFYSPYYGNVNTYSDEFEVGQTYSFQAYAHQNYRFVNWTRNGIVIGTDRNLEYTVPIGDHTLVANYEYDPESPQEPGGQLPRRRLTVNANPEKSASVHFYYEYTYYSSALVEEGQSVYIYASENPDYDFINWTDADGTVVSTIPDFSYTMPGCQMTLTANYVYNYDPASPDEPGTPNPGGSIAENMVLWPRMGMYDDTHVQILCETPGATIHYTLDGTTPNASSPVYTSPVYVERNLLVKAIAYKEGMEDSPVVSYQVTAYKTAAPVFTFENFLLKITSDTPGATIRYTLDFTDPNEESEIYTAPFLPEENCRIKAYASKDGLTDSPIKIFVFRRADYTLQTPTFHFNEDGKLVISSGVVGEAIRYTTDGSDPTDSSELYTEPLTVDGNYTIKAYATHPNYYDSQIGEYVVDGFKVEKPTYSFVNPILTLSTATTGATIRYTLDGTVPTEESESYSSPLRLTHDCQVVAKGFKERYIESDTVVFNYVYKDFQLPTPTAEFANRHLTLACSDKDAQIYYSIVNQEALPEFSLYEAPIALTHDCNVIFYASREHFNDSERSSYQFVLADHTVKAPVITYDSAAMTVTMACSTESAQIRYTTDGSIPTATTGTVYTDPVPVVGNMTFNAIAVRSDLFDSEVVTLMIDDQNVLKPTATFANKLLTLSCPDPLASIRYATDNSAPSVEWTLYEAPIALTQDCIVRYFATREGFNDTEGEPYVFVYSDHQVATPIFSYDLQTRTISISCATPNAEIRYTTDGSDPTATTGIVYTQPVAVVGNQTFKAIATRIDLFDSEVATRTVNDQQVETPTAKYAGHCITLECATPDALIHYTLDGTKPTSASALYTRPIPVENDCMVRFMATKEGFRDSEENSFEFIIAAYIEAMPTLTPDYRGRTIGITQAEGLPVTVSVDGRTSTVDTPATIQVTPGMGSISAFTPANDEDMFGSEEVAMEIVFHSAPKLDYDSMSEVSVQAADDEPMAEAIEFFATLDGKAIDATAGIKISGFGEIAVHTESDYAFRSEPKTLLIDYYNIGKEAGARNGHRLAEAFPEWIDKDDYESLRVAGELGREDFLFVSSLPQLTTFDIATQSLAEESFDGVLAGSRIETVSSTVYPQGMLKGMPRLTTVVWESNDERMPDGRLSEAGNPNILFWTSDRGLAPADATNIVTSTGDAEGKAESISLFAGYPFNAHRSFTAKKARVEKNFGLPTVIGQCAGWETITLPFDTDSIIHERAGRIVPYMTWGGPADTAKPFWLYSADGTDWETADRLQAGVPYIISMPNNDEYVEGYSLPGKVIFAARDVTFGNEESLPKATSWKEGAEFVGTFMPVDEEGTLSLNVNRLGDLEYLGSAFVEDEVTAPFGAYVRGNGLPKRIPVFGDWSGVMTAVADAAGIVVETPAAGMIRVSSGRECRVAIVTPEGATVRTLSIKAGECVTVEGLTRGLYIVGGMKVMVR